jgi:dihydroxyacid dehydratase/phosphogluconate dehydratase
VFDDEQSALAVILAGKIKAGDVMVALPKFQRY